MGMRLRHCTVASFPCMGMKLRHCTVASFPCMGMRLRHYTVASFPCMGMRLRHCTVASFPCMGMKLRHCTVASFPCMGMKLRHCTVASFPCMGMKLHHCIWQPHSRATPYNCLSLVRAQRPSYFHTATNEGWPGYEAKLYSTINYSYFASSMNPAVKERFNLISGRQNHPLPVCMTM